MPRVYPFTVVAELPQRLIPLGELANNLWWSWSRGAIDLFSKVARERCSLSLDTCSSPTFLIHTLSQDEIHALENDPLFLDELNVIFQAFQKYKSDPSWWSKQTKETSDITIAYFSAEFGFHESLPIYSGGLGVLAGDFMKAASDLGIPLIGVGLLYYEGYFHQYLSRDGWQQELNNQIDITKLPLQPVLSTDGKPLRIQVPMEGQLLWVQAWQMDVGRNKVYLLDTNIDLNDSASRAITSRLYAGDIHSRIKQEIILGIGGLKILSALGTGPFLCHMNDGHSAFLVLEQLRTLVKTKGLTFEQALQAARQSNVFTTHTPVPAGNDVFPGDIISRYLGSLAPELGIDFAEILKLGRVHPENPAEGFSMNVFAIRNASKINGVSALHGEVSQKLWSPLWPSLPTQEVPIRHITNGIHLATWTSPKMADLFVKYLGENWHQQVSSPEHWLAVNQIPDEELWEIKRQGRSQLIDVCRRRLKSQLMRRGVGSGELEDAGQVLHPDTLTIGFARRFVPYKRAALILRDIERFTRLINNKDCPVQFLFAGKAHPADQPGKEFLAQIVRASRSAELRHRFVFLEDYDIGLARLFLQGVDVWLNTPRRPLEASGTSGMKAAVNGALNVSVLDGWWCEAFDGSNGWSIGQGEEYFDHHYQDEIESRNLYDILEREVIPMFYHRTDNNVARTWLARVKHSIRTIAPFFNASRMVSEYGLKYYLPALQGYQKTIATNYEREKQAANAISRLYKHWSELKILEVDTKGTEQLAMGESLPIIVTAFLGPLSPSEVALEVYFGDIDATNNIQDHKVTRLTQIESSKEPGTFRFRGTLTIDQAGRHGFSIRLVPIIDGQAQATIPGLIGWKE